MRLQLRFRYQQQQKNIQFKVNKKCVDFINENVRMLSRTLSSYHHGLLKLHGQILCILREKIVGQCMKYFSNNFKLPFQKRLEIYFRSFFKEPLNY